MYCGNFDRKYDERELMHHTSTKVEGRLKHENLDISLIT